MDTKSPLPPEIWERTPPEAQEYILHLEARVVRLEATVQDLLERLRQDSVPPRAPRRVIRPKVSGAAAGSPVDVGQAGNPGTRARRGR